MTTARRPEVFISATSADLRSCRHVIKEALLTLGCMPVEQTNFPPDHRTVREMLRSKIAACDAVVHLAGIVYGAEPSKRAPGEPRRSYTQLEYDLARELKKPLYVFVCGEDFAYDEHAPEDDEKRLLQQAHRAALSSSETLRYKVGSRDELALKVRELQTRVDSLGAELTKTRSWLGRGVTASIATLALLGGGLWWLNRRADHQEQTAREHSQKTAQTEARVERLETEVDQQRRYLKSVADAFTQQKSELDKLKVPEAEQFTRAIAKVAGENGIAATDLQASIELFVAATKADPNADFMDRALIEFAQKDFSNAAKNAAVAARSARKQRLAARELKETANAAEYSAATRERSALTLQGQAAYATKNYEQAINAFQSAIEITPETDASTLQEWGRLQLNLGNALSGSAQSGPPAAAAVLRTRAFDAYTAASRVLNTDPETAPLIAYNRALIQLMDGIWTTNSADREASLTAAEAVFSRLAEEKGFFLYRHRELIVTHRCLALYFLAQGKNASAQDSLYRAIVEACQFEYRRNPSEPIPPDKRSGLYEIHAAALIANAAQAHEKTVQEYSFFSAREWLEAALSSSQQDSPSRRASLLNNLALAQLMVARAEFDTVAHLKDPDTGEVFQELGRITPDQLRIIWEKTFAGFAESMALFEAQSLAFDAACVKANWAASLREFSGIQAKPERIACLERSVQFLRETLEPLANSPQGEQSRRWLIASLLELKDESDSTNEARIRQEIDLLVANIRSPANLSALQAGIFIWRFESLPTLDWPHKPQP